MRLPKGEFFGTINRQVESSGLRLSATVYEPLQQQPWHTHEHPTFFAHLSGEQIDSGADANWNLPCLAVAYHPSSAVHRSLVGPLGARGVNIEVPANWLEDKGLCPKDLGPHRVFDSTRVRAAALRFLRLYTSSPLGGAEADDLTLELIEAFVVRQFPNEQRGPHWLQQAIERLHDDFRGSFGLTTLARQVGIHPVHLARVFRKHVGCSVTEYLQRLRMNAAASQILSGDSLGNAALDAGFADQFHFSRTLKTFCGYSPKWLKRIGTC